MHPVQPTFPWGNNPFFEDEANHLAHEFPGRGKFHILQDPEICKKFDSLVDAEKNAKIEVNASFNIKAETGDTILIGNGTHLLYTAVVSHIQEGLPFVKIAVKNQPFKTAATKVKIMFNSKYRPPQNSEILYIFITKTSIFLVTSYFISEIKIQS